MGSSNAMTNQKLLLLLDLKANKPLTGLSSIDLRWFAGAGGYSFE